ncbi:hypothetical protein Clacol_003970 [Clathrus columnatus]|uniref:Uncharacterized protein n=1 Tax=Clathrus columnatus TaxID=1419009 RepID=A0AAV5A9S0_9AGAM|nr:hypothetical protein Clacol_003970 [Clathrus columnatus]
MSDNINDLVSSTTEKVVYPTEIGPSVQRVKMEETTVGSTEPHLQQPLHQSEIKPFEGVGHTQATTTVTGTAPQTGQALDQFEVIMSEKTNEAVNEGKHDVDEAKATGVGYVQQAKDAISDVANAAQEYVSVGMDGHTPTDPNTGQGVPLVASIQSAANTAYEKGKIYLVAAQETAEPHVRKVQETVQPHAQSLIDVAKPYVNKAQSAISSALGTSTTSDPKQNGGNEHDGAPKV